MKVLRPHLFQKELMILWLHRILNPSKPSNSSSTPGPSCASSTTSAQQPVLHMPPLNWSPFKPKFSGQPDEDAEAHLLRTNDWMDTHWFQDNAKVQRFCLTLTGEARLWHKSLRLINVDWLGLQNNFRQQYSKISNTREQLFHTWRSFHFDENVQTINAYIHYIRQVTTLLGNQEPQILEVFKTHFLQNYTGFFSW